MSKMSNLVENSERELERLNKILEDAQHGSDMLELMICINLENSKLSILKKVNKFIK